MSGTLLKADGWTVYQLSATQKWAADVKLPERLNGRDTVSCYEFETRTEAVDWCLDLVAMRNRLPETADRFPDAVPCQLPDPPA